MKKSNENVRKLLKDGAVFKALQAGSKRAVQMHKLLGNPVSIWRDGKVVIVKPEDIQIDSPSD